MTTEDREACLYFKLTFEPFSARFTKEVFQEWLEKRRFKPADMQSSAQ